MGDERLGFRGSRHSIILTSVGWLKLGPNRENLSNLH